ncbi:MAG: DUF1553 domain-containing protein [Planctomycetales bacterium]|nr:DUF1553 domain-containing protein [Planctomycetales bacterium]
MLLMAIALPGLPNAAAEETEAAGKAYEETPVAESDREHWSFRPLTRPSLPQPDGAHLARNAIDLFVIAKLNKSGLVLQPPAAPETLLRRLSFDLTGLPPTTEQLARCSSETASEAGNEAANEAANKAANERSLQAELDRLFASPAYGERWAQHWLDLARFAETDGFEHDKIRKNAWQYRDWVVRAWNEGMPYDAFVRAQLAGDQAGVPVATWFCTSGPDMPDINSQDERRHELLNEMTGAVSSVLLGLQLACAQCHDHKYDPLSQGDFYRLRAMFQPALHVVHNRSIGPLAEQADTEVSHLLIRGDWRRPGPEVAPAVPRVVNPEGVEASTRAELSNWLTRPGHPLTARVMVNRLWQHHFGRGLVGTPSDFGAMGDWPTHPELLDYLASELVARNWSLRQLQRLVVDSATYRQRSRLPADATADTRRQWELALERDPADRLLSRGPRKRLEGEAVRDAMLFVGDSLNREMGGPGVRPPLPPELKGTLLRGQWDVSPASDHYRRSVYVFARRNLRYPIFEVLDRPDANASCPQRAQSTTAPQALLLLNSPVALDAARRLAGAVVARSDDREEQVRHVFRRCLARWPEPEETSAALGFLAEHERVLRDAGRQSGTLAIPRPLAKSLDPYHGAALVEFCLAMLNSNEFLYLD